jgi:hypothetical protein
LDAIVLSGDLVLIMLRCIPKPERSRGPCSFPLLSWVTERRRLKTQLYEGIPACNVYHLVLALSMNGYHVWFHLAEQREVADPRDA